MTLPTPPGRLGTVRTLARLYPFVRPAVPRILLGMAAALAAALVALGIPLVLQTLVDGPLASGDSAQVWPAALAVLALGALEAAFILARRWAVLTPGTHVEAAMRGTLYARLQDLPVAFHDRWQSGQLLSRAMSDLNLIRRWLSFGLVLLVIKPRHHRRRRGRSVRVEPDPRDGLPGLLDPAVGLRLRLRAEVLGRSHGAPRSAGRPRDGGRRECARHPRAQGVRARHVFARAVHAPGRRAARHRTRQGPRDRGHLAVAPAVPDVAFALCLAGGIWLASEGSLSVGALFAFFATATVLRFPIESIGFLLSLTFDTRTATERLFEVLDEPKPDRRPEAPGSGRAPRAAGVPRRPLPLPGLAASVPDLLDGVDLDLEPGETMALVGLTGSGKTTLTALTTRLYDVTGGAILLDGVDIRDLTRGELRARIAMAFEDATLFSASVRDNVLLGRPDLADGGPDAEAALAEALDIAQAEFVAALPDGANTVVGEEGMSLSGGQRQRLALARAVAAKPDVLVLDDPLSALDVDTEAPRRGGAAPRAALRRGRRPRHDGPHRSRTARRRCSSRIASRSCRRAASARSARTRTCWPPTSTTGT